MAKVNIIHVAGYLTFTNSRAEMCTSVYLPHNVPYKHYISIKFVFRLLIQPESTGISVDDIFLCSFSIPCPGFAFLAYEGCCRINQ